jgi:limonene 1,2-monooxygenase
LVFFCQQTHDWADWEATRKSYELYARFVMPHFRNANAHRVVSLDWVERNAEELGRKRMGAVEKMFAKHEAERQARTRAAE